MSIFDSLVVFCMFVAKLKFRDPARPNGAGGVFTSGEFPSFTSSLTGGGASPCREQRELCRCDLPKNSQRLDRANVGLHPTCGVQRQDADVIRARGIVRLDPSANFSFVAPGDNRVAKPIASTI